LSNRMANEGYELNKKAYLAKQKVDDEMDDLVKHFHGKYVRPAVAEKYYCLARCQEIDESVDIVNQCMSECGADIPSKKTIIYKELEKLKQSQEKAYQQCADETESRGKGDKYFSGCVAYQMEIQYELIPLVAKNINEAMEKL